MDIKNTPSLVVQQTQRNRLDLAKQAIQVDKPLIDSTSTSSTRDAQSVSVGSIASSNATATDRDKKYVSAGVTHNSATLSELKPFERKTVEDKKQRFEFQNQVQQLKSRAVFRDTSQSADNSKLGVSDDDIAVKRKQTREAQAASIEASRREDDRREAKFAQQQLEQALRDKAFDETIEAKVIRNRERAEESIEKQVANSERMLAERAEAAAKVEQTRVAREQVLAKREIPKQQLSQLLERSAQQDVEQESFNIRLVDAVDSERQKADRQAVKAKTEVQTQQQLIAEKSVTFRDEQLQTQRAALERALTLRRSQQENYAALATTETAVVPPEDNATQASAVVPEGEGSEQDNNQDVVSGQDVVNQDVDDQTAKAQQDGAELFVSDAFVSESESSDSTLSVEPTVIADVAESDVSLHDSVSEHNDVSIHNDISAHNDISVRNIVEPPQSEQILRDNTVERPIDIPSAAPLSPAIEARTDAESAKIDQDRKVEETSSSSAAD